MEECGSEACICTMTSSNTERRKVQQYGRPNDRIYRTSVHSFGAAPFNCDSWLHLTAAGHCISGVKLNCEGEDIHSHFCPRVDRILSRSFVRCVRKMCEASNMKVMYRCTIKMYLIGCTEMDK